MSGRGSHNHKIEDLLKINNILVDCCLVFEKLVVIGCESYIFMFEIQELNLIGVGIQCHPFHLLKLHRLNEQDCMVT